MIINKYAGDEILNQEIYNYIMIMNKYAGDDILNHEIKRDDAKANNS